MLEYDKTKYISHLNIYMLPAKWIRQANPFRLAQISPAEWNQDVHKHLDRLYEKQIRKIRNIYFFYSSFENALECQVNVYYIPLIWSMVRDENTILQILYEKQIWSDYK